MSFQCNSCSLSCACIKKYNLHQYFHRHEKGKLFKCMFSNCFQVFKTYASFKTHNFRLHEVTNLKTCSKSYTCLVTDCCFKSSNIDNIFSHALMHIKNNVVIKCPMFSSCNKTDSLFKSVAALNKHKQRYHFKAPTVDALIANTLDQNEHQGLVEESACIDSLEIDNFDTIELETQSLTLFSNLFQNLESKCFLSKSSIQILTNSIRDIQKLNSQFVLKNIQCAGIDINSDLIENNLFDKALNSKTGMLRSDFTRIMSYEKRESYVHPVKIDLIKVLDNGIQEASFFYYVPILKTLQVMLKNKNVFDMCFREVNTKDGCFFDIYDGNIFKHNSFFVKYPHAIRLILFQDAFELCNPLGSSRKKHKIVGIYMVLGNLYPWFRSKLDNIQLVALCYDRDIKNFGFQEILKPIISDIKDLEINGIQTCMNINIKGTLLAMVGDNLGSHQIGGFLQNFNTNNFFCRYCYAKDFSTANYNTILKLRNKNSYSVDAITAEALGAAFNGIKCNSKLNDLSYYHVSNPGLPPCLAHDLYEGVVQSDFMLIINKLVKDKVFTYDIINLKIKELKLVNGDNVSFPLIKKYDKLNGTASQNMQLLNSFPFIVLDLVKTPNEYWNMLLILRKICNLCLALQLSVGQISLLRELLFEYIEYRTRLFPNVPLKPKHHYILHYPHLILQFGPLRHLWTLRFEGKHSYFKNVIRHSPNFKNVLLSLSRKHQLLQNLCYSQDFLFHDHVYANQSQAFIESDFSDDYVQLITSCDFEGTKFFSSEVEYRGITYKNSMFVCVGKNSEQNYILCKIQNIIINNQFSSICFVGSKVEIYYDEDLGLFSVSKNSNVINICCPYDNVLCYEPVICCVIKEQYYFYFKSAPLDLLH